MKLNKKFWLVFGLLFLLVCLSRLLFLSLRPIHHDEGMLAYFAWQLTKSGDYTYTPQIHGPILFYVQAALFFIKTNTYFLRLGPALFGIFLVTIPLFFRRYLSKGFMIWFILLALLSPLLTYYSRFLVHTALVTPFILLFVFFAWRFFRTFKSNNLFWAFAMLAVSFGVSETTYLFCAVVLAFIPVAWLFDRKKYFLYWAKFKKFVSENRYDVISGVMIFFLVWILIYSVGLTSPTSLRISLPNPYDPQSSLGFWLAQHKTHLGGQPWFYYILLTLVYEPVVALGFLLALANFTNIKSMFYKFICWWAVGSFIAFSIAGEKFPWLLLPTLLAMLVLVAWFFADKFKAFTTISKVIWIILLAFSAFNVYRLNFISPADTNELAVYVQTPDSFTSTIDKITKTCAGQKDDCVLIDPKISWPLSWDFRDFGRLDNLDKNTIPKDTKFVFLSPEIGPSFDTPTGWKKTTVTLRDWWVPNKCRKLPCAKDFADYFLTRKTWNPKGNYDVFLLERTD